MRQPEARPEQVTAASCINSILGRQKGDYSCRVVCSAGQLQNSSTARLNFALSAVRQVTHDAAGTPATDQTNVDLLMNFHFQC